MTAISPYAPIRKDIVLHHHHYHPEDHLVTTMTKKRKQKGMILLTLTFLILQFWKKNRNKNTNGFVVVWKEIWASLWNPSSSSTTTTTNTTTTTTTNYNSIQIPIMDRIQRLYEGLVQARSIILPNRMEMIDSSNRNGNNTNRIQQECSSSSNNNTSTKTKNLTIVNNDHPIHCSNTNNYQNTRYSPPTNNNNNNNNKPRNHGRVSPTKEDTSTTTTTTKEEEVLLLRIRDNHKRIRKVMDYWFGTYTPEESQKKLWMIASSSIQWRKQVDEEIAKEFSSFIRDLVDTNDNDDTLFSPSPLWKELCDEEEGGGELYGYYGKVATVIALDQMSRHIHRYNEEQKQPEQQQQQQQQQQDTQQEETKKKSKNKLYNTLSINSTTTTTMDTTTNSSPKIMKTTTVTSTSTLTTTHNTQRESNSSSKTTSTWIPSIQILDQLAYQTSELFIQKHANEINCGLIPISIYIFMLMPYRHTKNIQHSLYVQNCIETIANDIGIHQMDAMVGRFRKATNRRLAILQHEERRMGKNNNKASTIISTNTNTNNSATDTHTTTTNTTTTASTNDNKDIQIKTKEDKHVNEDEDEDDDILEAHAFEADLSDASSHSVHKCMIAFLASRGIHPSSTNANGSSSTPYHNNHKAKNRQKNKQRNRQPQSTVTPSCRNNNNRNVPYPMIVSLSGGVDSMVIVSVLVHLRDYCDYNINIIAIHIDYANRPESSKEAMFLQKYCDQHNIAFVIRRIDEVTRGITARDIYERITRDVRYATYRQVISQYSETLTATTGTDDSDKDNTFDDPNDTNTTNNIEIGIMLGHHKGDLRENVLTNAHKGCGPLDLSGMIAVSQNDGVTIYRPLLSLEKTDIFHYSHKYGVPYFKDTTPHWSTRGKLRNKLLPLLEEIYGEGCKHNLNLLAIESDECRALLQKTSFEPFLEKVINKPMGIIFDTAPWKNQGDYFWKFILRLVLHKNSLGMFSDKSVISFLERIQAEKVRSGWLQCRKDYGVYLRSNGTVFVFYPTSFPWHKNDSYDCIGKAVKYGLENAVTIGPWKIVSELWNHSTGEEISDSERDHLLGKKAVTCMDTFMEGFVQYFVKVPTFYDQHNENEKFIPRPLVFVSSFTKESRPLSWKNTDEKIQSIIPLLGNDDIAAKGLKDPIGVGCVTEVDGSITNNPVYLVRVTMTLTK